MMEIKRKNQEQSGPAADVSRPSDTGGENKKPDLNDLKMPPIDRKDEQAKVAGLGGDSKPAQSDATVPTGKILKRGV